MDCSFAKDFAGPLATVVAAGAAVWVTAHFSSQQAETARRQAKTAKDQLRLNLFDKRYVIYKDIEQRLTALLNAADVETTWAAAQLFMAIDEVEFFFSPATCEWLRTVRGDCQDFLDAKALEREGKGDPRQTADLQIKVVRDLGAMADRFHGDLSLSQLTSD